MQREAAWNHLLQVMGGQVDVVIVAASTGGQEDQSKPVSTHSQPL